MFITPAYAQAGGAGSLLQSPIILMVLLFVIMYMLIIRPQQKRQKEHREMVANVHRGDTVVTGGGLVGKVTKVVDENEAMIEVAEGVRVRIVKSMIAEVRVKGEPAKSEDKKS